MPESTLASEHMTADAYPHTTPDAVVIRVAGAGGLPKIVLTATDGARIEVYLHGAHVTSWIPAGEMDDRLFMSVSSPFEDGMAMRGGVPVCFPQFADQGPLPMHGFARLTPWELVHAGRIDGGAVRAQLLLADSGATRNLWPHSFAAVLTVTASGPALALELAVSNTSATAFAFTTALHTYLRVADIANTRVRGLQGARYRDKNLRQDDIDESAAELVIDRPLDRIYHAVPAVLHVREPDRSLAVRATGMSDTVIWNPGPAQNAALRDLDAGSYAHLLCVEAAVASRSITLLPGETWRGTQTLTAKARTRRCGIVPTGASSAVKVHVNRAIKGLRSAVAPSGYRDIGIRRKILLDMARHAILVARHLEHEQHAGHGQNPDDYTENPIVVHARTPPPRLDAVDTRIRPSC